MIAALRCPVCARSLQAEPSAQALRCPAGHSFDLAKQGYVNLGVGRKLPEGDTAEMVQARVDFLSAGHYAPLTTHLGDHELSGGLAPAGGLGFSGDLGLSDGLGLSGGRGPLVVDLGAGTGHYLAAVLDALPQAYGLAFDVSKPALRRAARAHPRAGAVLADTWGALPLADGCVDLLLNIFAPRNGAEMRRVLKDDGMLIVVTPTPRHLSELRAALGLLSVDSAKEQRLAEELSDFTGYAEHVLEWRLDLTAAQADALVRMGPNAHHQRGEAVPAVCTASVRIGVYTV